MEQYLEIFVATIAVLLVITTIMGLILVFGRLVGNLLGSLSLTSSRIAFNHAVESENIGNVSREFKPQ